MKKNSTRTIVLYYDIFDETDFLTAVWNASKGMPLYKRLALVGLMQYHQKANGPAPKNSMYIIEVLWPTRLLGRLLYEIHADF